MTFVQLKCVIIAGGWITEVDIKNIEKLNKDGSPGIRQSRRIAQLKIKEQAECKYVEPVTTPKKTPANQKTKPVSIFVYFSQTIDEVIRSQYEICLNFGKLKSHFWKFVRLLALVSLSN